MEYMGSSFPTAAAELNKTNLYLKQGPSWKESSQGESTFARTALFKAYLLPRSAGLVALSISWKLTVPLLTRERCLHQEVLCGFYPSDLSHNNSAYEKWSRVAQARRPRQEDCKFKACLAYGVSSRVSWATYQDCVKKIFKGLQR